MKASGKDLRFELTDEIDIWLETKARCHSISRQEFVRETLHNLAIAYLREVRVAASLSGAKGLEPEEAGVSRNKLIRRES